MNERVLKAIGLGLAAVTMAALAAVVLGPILGRASRAEVECQANLHLIDNAKMLASLRYHLADGATVEQARLLQYLEGVFPACPGGGTYTINAIGQAPTCSKGGRHVLAHAPYRAAMTPNARNIDDSSPAP